MSTHGDEVKVPRPVKTQIKDILQPIVIRRSTLWRGGLIIAALMAVGVVLWATVFAPPSGEALLAEVVAAAGGMEAWNSLEEGVYTRVRTLYNEDGEVLRTEPVKYHFRKGAKGYGLMLESFTDAGHVIIGFDGKEYWAVQDGNIVDPRPVAQSLGMMCESDRCTPLCTAEMSFYRFSIPFKLTDPGANPEYIGSTVLNGRPVQLLEITFDPNVGRDRWVFFVDEESKFIRKVEHYPTVDGEMPPEEIYWSDHRTEGGITFSHRNTYYRSNGSKLEEYVIKDVEFNKPLPEEMFKKPVTDEEARQTKVSLN